MASDRRWRWRGEQYGELCEWGRGGRGEVVEGGGDGGEGGDLMICLREAGFC